MDEFSVLIGGKAGFGIDKSGAIIGRLMNRSGYRVYIYRDYPSIIRGGHTFSIIRAAKNRIAASPDKVDLILALDQETLNRHKDRLREGGFVIEAGASLKIIKEENAPEIMRNTSMIGAMAKAVGIDFAVVESVLRSAFGNQADLNVKIARRGFDEAKELVKIEGIKQESLPLISGNEAISLGLIEGGLDAYISYPMTPTSPVLHYLAGLAGDFGIDVIHPESEISVILMALGYAYAGKRAAVGTSGGGFCLMTEGVSFSGMAELPVVIVLGQRPGPSTGLPTYSSQSELEFALHAGHGEFTRLVVAPGDAEEAYGWASAALELSGKYRIPAIILTDKELGESVFNFDRAAAGAVRDAGPFARDTVSPRKVNSYEHDEAGITTEDPATTKRMQERRLGKKVLLSADLEGRECVKVYGNRKSKNALLCWGSNKGVCVEAARRLDMKVIQPVVMEPFPVQQFREAMAGVKRLISVESNATGQLARLVNTHDFKVDGLISKYDGRPFSCGELEAHARRTAL